MGRDPVKHRVGDEWKQELFLRHYYYAFGNKLNTSYGITEAKKRYRWPGMSSDSFYLDVFEGLIETNCEKLLNDLHEKSRCYAILKNNSETVFVYSQSLKELSASGGYLPSYILLLYPNRWDAINQLPNDSVIVTVGDIYTILYEYILKHENKILINQGRHLEIRTDSGIRYMRSFVFAEGRKHITVMETYHPATLGRNRFQWNDLSIFRNNQS